MLLALVIRTSLLLDTSHRDIALSKIHTNTDIFNLHKIKEIKSRKSPERGRKFKNMNSIQLAE
jgi:hypothetical protein